MSFILDALKKSEAERSRQKGPTLVDIRIAPPRRKLPLWVYVISAVLLANLTVLAVVLLRGGDTTATPASTSGQAAAEPAATLPPPPAPAASVLAQVSPATTTAGALPEPVLIAGAPQSAIASTSTASISLDDLPAGLPRSPSPAEVPGEALATAQDLIAGGVALPALQMSLHVYDANPANRYVLLNAVKLHEGETRTDGLKLERITPDGVVLSWQGRRFKLSSGGP
jgi:general secretion pathway protein B